jgi:hypothetical protein
MIANGKNLKQYVTGGSYLPEFANQVIWLGVYLQVNPSQKARSKAIRIQDDKCR